MWGAFWTYITRRRSALASADTIKPETYLLVGVVLLGIVAEPTHDELCERECVECGGG